MIVNGRPLTSTAVSRYVFTLAHGDALTLSSSLSSSGGIQNNLLTDERPVVISIPFVYPRCFQLPLLRATAYIGLMSTNASGLSSVNPRYLNSIRSSLVFLIPRDASAPTAANAS